LIVASTLPSNYHQILALNKAISISLVEQPSTIPPILMSCPAKRVHAHGALSPLFVTFLPYSAKTSTTKALEASLNDIYLFDYLIPVLQHEINRHLFQGRDSLSPHTTRGEGPT
jgi:hypothetical protein